MTQQKKTRTMYMHTINEKPAYWCERSNQIVYADVARYAYDRPNTNAVLRRDLRQIRRDQAKTRANRKSWGMKDDVGKYGYVRVEVPSHVI